MLSDRLLSWYAVHGRDLPWRRTGDPYAILVSEIMLQQTRVETVLPYYRRFMSAFPTFEALSGASLDEVLKVWEGLGYYARARNLHRAAQIIVSQHGGKLPSSYPEMIALPGIGSYTAAALQAIVFDRDTLALEGNLRRVLTRLLDLHLDPRSSEGERELQQLGMSHLPEARASEFNQALMDLGALVCTPRSPKCTECPLAKYCLAHHNGTQQELPIRRPKQPLPQRQAVAAVLNENGSLLLVRRPEGGLLGGLWGFPGGFVESGESDRQALTREIREQLGMEVVIESELSPLKHTYSHFHATLHPYLCRTRTAGIKERGNVRWVLAEDLETVPMGKLDRMLARELASAPARL